MTISIDQSISELTQWRRENNRLVAEFTFDDFQAAFDFMTKVAAEAERLNHHPFWQNQYNTVSITLSTADEDNSITHKDIDLAKAISLIAGKTNAIVQEQPQAA